MRVERDTGSVLRGGLHGDEKDEGKVDAYFAGGDSGLADAIRRLPPPDEWPGCYLTLELQSDPAPACEAVDEVIVLTMADAEARHEALSRQLTALRQLGRRVVLQLNRGFRRCRKPARVDGSAHDLVHAMLRALRWAEARSAGNVALVEDDVLFRGCSDRLPASGPHPGSRPESKSENCGLRRHLARVNDFLRSGVRFNTYNLGCFADLLVPVPDRAHFAHHRRIKGYRGTAHCVVWSPRGRSIALSSVDLNRMPPDFTLHWDNGSVVTPMRDDAFTYRLPLAMQILPITDNSSSWCVRCEKGRPDPEMAARRAAIRMFGLDHSVRPGWALAYGGGFGLCGVYVAAALTAIVAVGTAIAAGRLARRAALSAQTGDAR